MIDIIRRALVWVVAIVILLAILSFMFTYTVRFNEVAVKTTFGSAAESVADDAGLKFKWPYPIQSVTKYDKRLRLIESRLETVPTADNRQVIAQAFATYRVVDANRFYGQFANAGDRPLDHFRQADSTVQDRLRAALSQIGQYSLSQIFNEGEGESVLPEIEERMQEMLESGAAQGVEEEYGIQITSVGIHRLVFPESVTESIITRMAANRSALAVELSSQGQARAASIESAAEADARKIQEFAEARASAIRSQGDREAAAFLAVQAQDDELAVFLANMEFLTNAVAKKTTLILSTSHPGLNALSPSFLDASGSGIPSPISEQGDPDQTSEEDAQ